MSLLTYEKLRRIVERVLRHYQDDLHKFDRNTLSTYDGPFVYGYRRTGTDFLRMLPSVAEYFEETQPTPAEIERCLKESFTWIDYQDRNTHFLYFDGKRLHTKSAEDLRTIWLNHVDRILGGLPAMPALF